MRTGYEISDHESEDLSFTQKIAITGILVMLLSIVLFIVWLLVRFVEYLLHNEVVYIFLGMFGVGLMTVLLSVALALLKRKISLP